MSISKQEYEFALRDVFRAQATIENSTKTKAQLQQLIAINQAQGIDFTDLLDELDTVDTRIASAEANLSTANSTIDEFLKQTTIPSESDQDTLEKYQNANATDATDGSEATSSINSLEEAGISPEDLRSSTLERIVPGIPPGAESVPTPPPRTNFNSLLGDKSPLEDLRVKIRVPPDYLRTTTSGPNGELSKLSGIIFPYTPSISYELKADYATSTPLHSNFPINFYQRSTISAINIVGKFSVENATDAGAYISTVHLLKALTRMRFGLDSDSGAPPPVCRLDAYGEMMMKNVPIAITSFRIELPDSVDYFTFNSSLGLASVPTISTISIVCIPMYSRNEMQRFSVSKYLDNGFKGQGII